jgi:phosphohistidine phosphatase
MVGYPVGWAANVGSAAVDPWAAARAPRAPTRDVLRATAAVTKQSGSGPPAWGTGDRRQWHAGFMTAASEDRVLVLVRHSEAGSGAPDEERELTEGGWADAREAGRWLHELGLGVDEVLCSTATRARQTCEAIWDGGCSEADVHHDSRLYNASAQRLLDVIREADADATVVMVVGHAPGVPYLTSILADGEGSDQAHEALAEGFPTSGIAILSYAGHWSDLGPATARLDRFHVARANVVAES